ncbi:hypothetical protein [Pandoravirus japonicus]|uniref:Uncharacterized protein n=1 Tax=Pandoravirus japonicus TaxID=2823154 RepID=A0A811BPE7_9VIRU|nr:hypothetical protein [Pandoravirus japonicus]
MRAQLRARPTPTKGRLTPTLWESAVCGWLACGLSAHCRVWPQTLAQILFFLRMQNDSRRRVPDKERPPVPERKERAGSR